MNTILFDASSTAPISAIVAVAPGDCLLINAWGLAPGQTAQVFRVLVALGSIPAQQSGSCVPPPAVQGATIQTEVPYAPCNATVEVGQTPTENLTSILLQQPGFYRLHLTPAAVGTAIVEAVVLTGADACAAAAAQCCCAPQAFWDGSSTNPCLVITPGGALGHSPVFSLDPCCLLESFPSLANPVGTDELVVLSGGNCFRSQIVDVFANALFCEALATFPVQAPAAGDVIVALDAADNCKRLDAETLVEFFETPWTGISLNPNLTIAPGGVNGHGPTFDYDLCADLNDLPVCGCEPVTGDLIPIIQAGNCTLATFPEVDFCVQVGALVVGTPIAGDTVPVREAGGTCKQVPIEDFPLFPILAPDGTCAAPSYSFDTDPASGMLYEAGVPAVTLGFNNCSAFVRVGDIVRIEGTNGDFIEVGASITLQTGTSFIRINSGDGEVGINSLGGSAQSTAPTPDKVRIFGARATNPATLGGGIDIVGGLTSAGGANGSTVTIFSGGISGGDGGSSMFQAQGPIAGIIGGIARIQAGPGGLGGGPAVGGQVVINGGTGNGVDGGHVIIESGVAVGGGANGGDWLLSIGANAGGALAGDLIIQRRDAGGPVGPEILRIVGVGGEWQLATNPGVAGQHITSQGAGLPPVWAAAGTFPLLAPNGSCAAPSYSFTASPDSGMFYTGTAVRIGDDNCTDFIEIGASINITSNSSAVAVSASTTLTLQSTAGPVTIFADTGITLTSGGAPVTVNSATRFIVITAATPRLEIQTAGAWLIGASVGLAGQVITSAGAGAPPTWANSTPAFPLLAPNGSCLAPSYSFTASPDSGMFYTGTAVRIGDDNCVDFIEIGTSILMQSTASTVTIIAGTNLAMTGSTQVNLGSSSGPVILSTGPLQAIIMAPNGFTSARFRPPGTGPTLELRGTGISADIGTETGPAPQDLLVTPGTRTAAGTGAFLTLQSGAVLNGEGGALGVVAANGTVGFNGGSVTITGGQGNGGAFIGATLVLGGGTTTAPGVATLTGILVLPNYTVATLPTAAHSGGFIYVTDESGGAVPAFSDTVNWRRVTDRAIVT